MARSRKKRPVWVSAPEQIRPCLEQFLASLDPDGFQAKLCQLWQHWEMVMGPVLAELVLPLGHHRDVLLVAACDPMVMQELQMHGDDILDRVNAFMDGSFKSVRISLPMGRRILTTGLAWGEDSLDNPDQDENVSAENSSAEQARPTGIYLAEMDPESPVARCYARFVGKKCENGAKIS